MPATLVVLDRFYDRDRLAALLGDAADVTYADELEDAARAQVALGFGRVLGTDLKARLPALRGVIAGSTGYDHLDLDALRARGLVGTNVPDYCTQEVADYALACTLAALRGIVDLDQARSRSQWGEALSPGLRRVRGATLGVIGLGAIGSRIATDAASLGMQVLAYDPFIAPACFARASTRAVKLPELLSSSDVVTVHTPLDATTRNLIGAPELALMRPHSALINAARSGIVDLDALAAGLARNQPAWAFFDVWESEPPDPEDRRVDAPNLVLTPHSAWYSPDAEAGLYAGIAEATLAIINGENPRGRLT